MSALDQLRALQAEVGARRAGSSGERKAQEWLVARSKALGLHVDLDDFTYIGNERYRPLMNLVSLLWIVMSVVLASTGRSFLGLALFFVLIYLQSAVRKRLEVRLARTKGSNVLAGLRRKFSDYVADPDKGPAVLVCAHYDTPRNLPPWFPKIRGAIRILGPIAILGLILFVGSALLSILSWILGSYGLEGASAALDSVVSWAYVLVGILSGPFVVMGLVFMSSSLLRRKEDSPGADDNGSGTALVLELAKRLRQDPPKCVEVFLAWWGAEELGLFGSRQFVRRFDKHLDKERFYLMNADCVGVGDLLTVHTGQGVIRRRATSPAIVERIERIAGSLGVKTIRSWESIISGGSSDHAEWVDRGYKNAISMLRENYRPLSLPAKAVAAILRIPDANQLDIEHVHTEKDTLEVIKPQVLDETMAVAEAYLREIDEECAGEGSRASA